MSSFDSQEKKLNNTQVTKLIKSMYKNNSKCIIISKHCKLRMLERNININDIINLIKLGKCTGSELHIVSQKWVYRIETNMYRLECNINNKIIAITVIRKK